MRALATHECKGTCCWGRATVDGSPAECEGEPLFVCASCRSEWVPSQPWTPRDADGAVSPEVKAARSAAGVVTG